MNDYQAMKLAMLDLDTSDGDNHVRCYAPGPGSRFDGEGRIVLGPPNKELIFMFDSTGKLYAVEY